MDAFQVPLPAYELTCFTRGFPFPSFPATPPNNLLALVKCGWLRETEVGIISDRIPPLQPKDIITYNQAVLCSSGLMSDFPGNSRPVTGSNRSVHLIDRSAHRQFEAGFDSVLRQVRLFRTAQRRWAGIRILLPLSRTHRLG